MRIIELQVENFKRLSAVHITPGDVPVVTISGRNTAGKSSVLDSIAAVMGGRACAPDDPIRHGADKAKIVARLNGLIVTRTFTPSGGTLIVENEDGAVYRSPQGVLDQLTGSLAFDPLAFSRMAPKQQAATLRDLTGLDFADLDNVREQAYDARAEWNREIKRRQAELQLLPEFTAAPIEEVRIGDLMAEAERRRAVNNRNAERRQQVERVRQRIGSFDQQILGAKESENESQIQLGSAIKEVGEDLERQIIRLRREAAESVKRLQDAHEHRAAVARERIETAINAKRGSENLLSELTANVAAAMDEDVEVIVKQVASAEQINTAVRSNAKRQASVEGLEEAKKRADRADAEIGEIDRKRADRLASAKLPVPGLSFDADGVMFNGVPFSQASGAEQLRVSVACGFAANPKLRVMLVRDGSLLDENGLKLLSELAEQYDGQVWVERVSNGERVGVVIEDGCTARVQDEVEIA